MLNVTSEKAFLKELKAAAKVRGWRMHHETYSMGTASGYPDCTLVHPTHGVIWLELKVSKARGKIYPKQVEWIDALQEAGQTAFIVYPAHWPQILDLLDGRNVTIHDNDAQKELPL